MIKNAKQINLATIYATFNNVFYFADEELPKKYGVKLPDGSLIPLTLPIKIDRNQIWKIE